MFSLMAAKLLHALLGLKTVIHVYVGLLSWAWRKTKVKYWDFPMDIGLPQTIDYIGRRVPLSPWSWRPWYRRRPRVKAVWLTKSLLDCHEVVLSGSARL